MPEMPEQEMERRQKTFSGGGGGEAKQHFLDNKDAQTTIQGLSLSLKGQTIF